MSWMTRVTGATSVYTYRREGDEFAFSDLVALAHFLRGAGGGFLGLAAFAAVGGFDNPDQIVFGHANTGFVFQCRDRIIPDDGLCLGNGWARRTVCRHAGRSHRN